MEMHIVHELALESDDEVEEGGPGKPDTGHHIVVSVLFDKGADVHSEFLRKLGFNDGLTQLRKDPYSNLQPINLTWLGDVDSDLLDEQELDIGAELEAVLG